MADTELSDLTAATSRVGLQYYATDSGGTIDRRVPEGLPLPLDFQASDPSAPASNPILFAQRRARGVLRVLDPDADPYTLQPHLAFNKRVEWHANGQNTTTFSNFSSAALNSTGTATAVAFTTSTRYGMIRKVEYLVTVASTTAVAGLRGSSGIVNLNSGFHFVGSSGPATGVTNASHRFFLGMIGSNSAPTDANPSAQTSAIGIGYDAADTEVQFMHNDASGTCTKVALGASFPKPSADRTNFYQLSLYAKPGGTTVYYWVTELTGGVVASGSVSTDLPASTQTILPVTWGSVGGVSSVVGIAMSHFYVETDL